MSSVLGLVLAFKCWPTVFQMWCKLYQLSADLVFKIPDNFFFLQGYNFINELPWIKPPLLRKGSDVVVSKARLRILTAMNTIQKSKLTIDAKS